MMKIGNANEQFTYALYSEQYDLLKETVVYNSERAFCSIFNNVTDKELINNNNKIYNIVNEKLLNMSYEQKQKSIFLNVAIKFKCNEVIDDFIKFKNTNTNHLKTASNYNFNVYNKIKENILLENENEYTKEELINIGSVFLNSIIENKQDIMEDIFNDQKFNNIFIDVLNPCYKNNINMLYRFVEDDRFKDKLNSYSSEYILCQMIRRNDVENFKKYTDIFQESNVCSDVALYNNVFQEAFYSENDCFLKKIQPLIKGYVLICVRTIMDATAANPKVVDKLLDNKFIFKNLNKKLINKELSDNRCHDILLEKYLKKEKNNKKQLNCKEN